jgi:hypothetical protein
MAIIPSRYKVFGSIVMSCLSCCEVGIYVGVSEYPMTS